MDEEPTSDPMLAMKIRMAGAAVGVAGLVYLVAVIVHLAPGLYLSGSSNPITESIDVRHHRWFGTEYAIRVGKGIYWCSGGDGQEQRRSGVPVTYDAERPERCRARAVVGRLGSYEVVAGLGASAFVAAGLGATALWNNKRARIISFAVAALLGWGYIAVSLIIWKGSHG